MKTTLALLIIVMMVLGLVGVIAFIPARVETMTTTIFNTTTMTATALHTTTIGLGETYTVTQPPIPPALSGKMEEIIPGSTTAATYHIKLPSKPGVYKYSFAVFWKFKEEHVHTIVIEASEGTRFYMMPSSLIQVRLAAASNVPNTPAPFGPNATLTEIALGDDGVVRSESWEMRPNVYGIPSKPQIETGTVAVMVVKYIPGAMGETGESLVARYYFLEISVR